MLDLRSITSNGASLAQSATAEQGPGPAAIRDFWVFFKAPGRPFSVPGEAIESRPTVYQSARPFGKVKTYHWLEERLKIGCGNFCGHSTSFHKILSAFQPVDGMAIAHVGCAQALIDDP
jgi:hypothetical protein